MEQDERQEFKSLIVEALKETPFSCCAAACKEKCGITPSEHAQQHTDLGRFFKRLDDYMTTAKRAAIGVVVIAVLSLIGTGLYTHFHHDATVGRPTSSSMDDAN